MNRALATSFFAFAFAAGAGACGGSDANSLTGASSTGKGGAATVGPGCTTLLLCCNAITDATTKQQCLDAEATSVEYPGGLGLAKIANVP